MSWTDQAYDEAKSIIADAAKLGAFDPPKTGEPGPWERIGAPGELSLAYAIDRLASNGFVDDEARSTSGWVVQQGRFLLCTDEQGFKRLESFLGADSASAELERVAAELDAAGEP